MPQLKVNIAQLLALMRSRCVRPPRWSPSFSGTFYQVQVDEERERERETEEGENVRERRKKVGETETGERNIE